MGPSDSCSNSNSCAECLKANTLKLRLTRSSYEDVVILLIESDFPCFHKHSEFSMVTARASPSPAPPLPCPAHSEQPLGRGTGACFRMTAWGGPAAGSLPT